MSEKKAPTTIGPEAMAQSELAMALKDKIIGAISDFWEEQPDMGLEIAELVVWLAMAEVLMHSGKVLGELGAEGSKG